MEDPSWNKSKNLVKAPIFWILLLSAVLLFVNIDAPFSGFHSWKELQGAGMALRFLKEGDLLAPRTLQGEATAFPLPIHAWIVMLFWRLFGVSEWAARLPMALFGIGGVYMIYRLGMEMYDRKTGYFAAFFMALAPFYVYFSRFAGQPPFILFFMIASVYCFQRWLKNGENRYAYLSAASLSLASINYYIPLYIVFPFALYLLVKGREKIRRIPLIPALAIIFLPTLAWFAYTMTAFPSFGYESAVSFSIWLDYNVHIMQILRLSMGTGLVVFLLSLPFLFLDRTNKGFLIQMWVLGGIFYLVLIMNRIVGNDYALVPLVPSFCIAGAVGIQRFGTGHRRVLAGLAVVSSLLLIGLIYSTQYPYEKAGYYLKDKVAENEIIGFTESPAPCFYAVMDFDHPNSMCAYVPELEWLKCVENEDRDAYQKLHIGSAIHLKGREFKYITMPSTFEKTRLQDDYREYLEENYELDSIFYGKQNIVGAVQNREDSMKIGNPLKYYVLKKEREYVKIYKKKEA